jgi:hypothetical protein
MKAKFTKGQTVYMACNAICRKGQIFLGIVISRTIDSCGAKQATFVDHGSVYAFGRKYTFAGHNSLFATAEEAFAALTCSEQHLVVLSDATNEWFSVCEAWIKA